MAGIALVWCGVAVHVKSNTHKSEALLTSAYSVGIRRVLVLLCRSVERCNDNHKTLKKNLLCAVHK